MTKPIELQEKTDNKLIKAALAATPENHPKAIHATATATYAWFSDLDTRVFMNDIEVGGVKSIKYNWSGKWLVELDLHLMTDALTPGDWIKTPKAEYVLKLANEYGQNLEIPFGELTVFSIVGAMTVDDLVSTYKVYLEGDLQ